MEESEGLAFDNLCSGSDTTVTVVDSLLAPHSLHVMSQESPHPPGPGVLPHPQWGHPWRQGDATTDAHGCHAGFRCGHSGGSCPPV